MDLKGKFSSDDDDRNDFFDGPDLPDPPQEEPQEKKPRFTPDDPRYWESEESPWEHLRIRRKNKIRIFIVALLLLVAIIVAFHLRFLSPYVEDATAYGYVDNIETRGTVFKTFEGILINYKELHDTTRLYTRDFIFTAADASVAATLKRMQLKGRPVRVTYKTYHATLPWRGASKTIVTEADSVDPATILPPEFRTR